MDLTNLQSSKVDLKVNLKKVTSKVDFELSQGYLSHIMICHGLELLNYCWQCIRSMDRVESIVSV